MKQKLLLLLAVLGFLLPARLTAVEYQSGGINYDLTERQDDDGNIIYEASVIALPNNNGYSGDIVIPSSVEYQGKIYSVTSIGDWAFRECANLSSVDIPNSVTYIGIGAFCSCVSLSSVEIPNSVTSIEYFTFGQSGLTSIDIPDSVTSIGPWAFINCDGLNSIRIPDSVTFIGDRAFDNCDLILFIICTSNVTFESTISPTPYRTYIPEGLNYTQPEGNIITFDPETTTFLNDGTILTDNGKTLLLVPVHDGMSYKIPEGVSKISTGAFCPICRWDRRFLDLDTRACQFNILTISTTIEEIEPDVFLYAEIEKVEFADWSKWYPYAKLGNLYSNPYWNSKPYVGGVEMEYPELPEGITEIPDYINYGLQFRDEIEIPRSIKRIGAYAFYNNKELFSVILPRNLEEIGESAFEGCELLENPSFPSGLKKIEDGAYKDCTSITEIELPEGLSMLGSRECKNGKGVFEGCGTLEKAVITVNIDYIADNLFNNCRVLDKIYFPHELKTIGNNAFEKCITLEEVTFPATLKYIGERAFMGDLSEPWNPEYGHISKLTIPDGVNQIGAYAFACQSIANLSIGEGTESVSDFAFYFNPKLKVINFSEGLKEIGTNAFDAGEYGNTCNIGSVELPSTVTTIGDNAFKDCYISNLVVPDEVETLGYRSCGKPSVLTLGSYVKNIDANAFSFEKLYTLRVKAHMPPTLSDAFPITPEQNDQLTLIVNKGRFSTYDTNARWKQIDRIVEEGYTEVEIYLDGTYSLAEEIRVQSGYMPSMVTKMMVDGPLSEQDLRVIKENMHALTSLDLSNVTNLTELPEGQFAGSLITEIKLPDNLESIGNGAFSDCRLLKLAELPASVKRIGDNAFSDCPEVNLVSLPEALEQIGSGAFSSSGMRELVAPAHLSEIGAGAFGGCVLLERADLSAAPLTNIADNAFSGCRELDEVILPASVKAIGSSAFINTALRNIDFAAGVETIGGGAFSGNRRLVSATLPETITRVGSNLFENCPRLISVSMPMTTAEVGSRVIGGDRKLANLSCSAEEAPAAETGAFDDVRHRYVTLTIPTLSFRKYLNSTQWGRFDCIKNVIKVNMDRGVKATSAAEAEYQDMLKEDELEAAQDAAAQQNGALSSAGVMRRAAARAKSVENFAVMFDGAQLTSMDSNNNRVFLTTEPGVNVTSILFDGEELIGSFDGQSVLLPEGRYGDLQIITDAKPGAAESILLSNTELTLTKGATDTLTATVLPSYAEDKTVVWASSNQSIATVNENGEVKAVGVGKATITASCGDVSAHCSVKCYPQAGDANWSGSVTITDAVDISNYVVMKKDIPSDWDKEEWTEFYTVGANANESADGKVTIADASAAINLALDDTYERTSRSRVGAARADDGTADALVISTVTETEDGRLSIAVKLDNTRDYVALQADVFHPAGLEVEVKVGDRASRHTLETRRYDDEHFRLALYNLSNKAFSAGDEPLLEFVIDGKPEDVEEFVLARILASDAAANEYELDFRMDASTGVEGVSEDSVVITKAIGGIHVSNAAGKRIDICTLEGKTVKSVVANDNLEIINLPAGIYIVRAGEKTLKVIL